MQRFFRLLAAASLTQVTFWTSYAFLPSELSGSMSYWGIVGSGSFVLIARHFAMHYVWEMDQISPVAFRIATHTFWGNKGPDRIVQIGTSQCQHTSRYIAAKIKGDSFYYLLDIKEGKFGSENAKEQIIRMFQGLRTDAQGQHLVRGVDGDNGDSAEQSDTARRKGGGRRWKGGWKGKA
ncbi:hypothetical protein NSK_001439 [Nannochloropsis salina CCMP1776]|uniref:Uncharacterized protein n=1 Tax=Nannochloropsis salina CCMP1776 TaxID=1027361 RepID=A0A4D9DC86_9STRA|nr:hypothetical protein NSK_001439 [Nannochloropsis salina CCMP1776]|eukprot:TFJ87105.1 hypothetical protein NSK_001439 [Nannochloropsis salina CCMP1776]